MLSSLRSQTISFLYTNTIANKTGICMNICRRIKYFYQSTLHFSKSAPKKSNVNLSYVSYEKTEESTTKPPIFIFHGVIGSKRQWEGIGKTILNITQRKVVAVDLRNHGDSPHMLSHKYTDQARDVLKLFEMLDAQQASLIGHSMGGRTAMCVALMAPQRVTGLQVVDISPTSTPIYFTKFLPRVLIAMKSINFHNPKRISVARAEVRSQLRKIVGDEYIMRLILANIKRKSDGTLGWACNLDGLIRDFRYWVTFPAVMPGVKYGGPTLFVGGQFSDFIPRGELNNIKTLFPAAIVTHIPKAGHYVQIDDPTTFLDITISFLQEHKYRISPNLTKQK